MCAHGVLGAWLLVLFALCCGIPWLIFYGLEGESISRYLCSNHDLIKLCCLYMCLSFVVLSIRVMELINPVKLYLLSYPYRAYRKRKPPKHAMRRSYPRCFQHTQRLSMKAPIKIPTLTTTTTATYPRFIVQPYYTTSSFPTPSTTPPFHLHLHSHAQSQTSAPHYRQSPAPFLPYFPLLSDSPSQAYYSATPRVCQSQAARLGRSPPNAS